MTLIPHNRIAVDEADALAVAQVVRSGYWAAGPACEALEERLASLCGRRHAVAVASGLSALRLALLGLSVGSGDRVIVPAYSCVAVANAVLSLGAIPVAADIDTERLTLSPDVLFDQPEPARCVIAVDTFGLPADYDELEAAGVPVIQDCAHGFGHGPLGRRGVVTVISLYATKFIGSGRGGVVLSDDPTLAKRIRVLRDYEDSPASSYGLNDKPDDLNAALALSRLDRLGETVARRAELAERYQSAFLSLAEDGRIGLPPEDGYRIWYRYTLRCNDATAWIDALKREGVEAARPVSNWLDEEARDKCPNASAAYREIVSLPLFTSLSKADQEWVISAVNKTAEALA